jgi:hypothetical protein
MAEAYRKPYMWRTVARKAATSAARPRRQLPDVPRRVRPSYFRGREAARRAPRFDTTSGKRIAQAPSDGETDDLFYDAKRDRVRVVGGEGFSSKSGAFAALT